MRPFGETILAHVGFRGGAYLVRIDGARSVSLCVVCQVAVLLPLPLLLLLIMLLMLLLLLLLVLVLLLMIVFPFGCVTG